MAMKELPDPELLRKLLRYEPETGKLFWRARPREMFTRANDHHSWNRRFANQPAFTTKSKGYLCGRVLYSKFKAHRIAWAIHHGQDPDDQIDHINGDRSDNRIVNLRVVTQEGNARNARRQSRNQSGVTGVCWSGRESKWAAYIRADGEKKWLGYFVSLTSAIESRKRAERKYGYHPNHGR